MSMTGSGELINENTLSDDDIPDDFFDELANAQFIEELVESAQDGDADLYDSGSNQNASRENSPRMARCLAEIDVLTKDIERRKKKLEKELSQKGLSEQDLRQKLDRDIEKDERRLHRSRRGRDRRPSRSQTRSRSRSHSSKSKSIIRSPSYRDRPRDRDREDRNHRRYQNKSPQTNHRRHGRRSRSSSPNGKRRSSSTHKNLTFLEELAKTFAAQGKPFHEADILAQSKINAIEQPVPMAPMMNTAVEPNIMPMQMNNMQQFAPTMPTHMNPIVYPNVGYPPNMYYEMEGLPTNTMAGINSGAPMIQSAHMNRNVTEISIPGTSAAMNNVQLTSAGGAARNSQKALLEKCARAVKFIHAEENKVPKLRFLFTRTHIDAKNQQNANLLLAKPRKSPLAQSLLNVEFNLNSAESTKIDAIAPKQQFPMHLREIVKALGINNQTLTSKMRSREIASQLSLDFMMTATSATAEMSDSIRVPLPTKEPEIIQVIAPIVETCSIITQTDPYECNACVVREKRVFLNKHTQVFSSHKSDSTQTDEDDYRSPLIEMLARLTDAQLVAIKDFIAIMMTTRPQNSMDICNLRERMMDIYNLSQRDADAVRVAQRNRLDDPIVINPKRFRSCDSFGDSGSSRDREFDNSPHSRRSNGSANFNQNEHYADPDDRQQRMLNEERRRIQEQQEHDLRYEQEVLRRRQAEDEAHEREKQRIRLLEEQEFQIRIQCEEQEQQERLRQQELLAAQQLQQEQLFGFGSRTNRDDAPSLQPTFRNANRNARGAFRNDRGGGSRGSSRGGRGRKF